MLETRSAERAKLWMRVLTGTESNLARIFRWRTGTREEVLFALKDTVKGSVNPFFRIDDMTRKVPEGGFVSEI